MPQFDWEPTPKDVGSVLRARTVDDDGNELGTFNDNTRPTGDGVQDLIETQCSIIDADSGEVPERLFVTARRVAALGTACLVELTYFPNEVASGRSPYEHLNLRYLADLKRLIEGIAAINAGGDLGDEDLTPIATFDDRCIIGFDTTW